MTYTRPPVWSGTGGWDRTQCLRRGKVSGRARRRKIACSWLESLPDLRISHQLGPIAIARNARLPAPARPTSGARETGGHGAIALAGPLLPSHGRNARFSSTGHCAIGPLERPTSLARVDTVCPRVHPIPTKLSRRARPRQGHRPRAIAPWQAPQCAARNLATTRLLPKTTAIHEMFKGHATLFINDATAVGSTASPELERPHQRRDSARLRRLGTIRSLSGFDGLETALQVPTSDNQWIGFAGGRTQRERRPDRNAAHVSSGEISDNAKRSRFGRSGITSHPSEPKVGRCWPKVEGWSNQTTMGNAPPRSLQRASDKMTTKHNAPPPVPTPGHRHKFRLAL